MHQPPLGNHDWDEIAAGRARVLSCLGDLPELNFESARETADALRSKLGLASFRGETLWPGTLSWYYSPTGSSTGSGTITR